MGALHDGHAALIRLGSALARQRRLAGGCVVSIFVNPTQFNEPADYQRYPRTLNADEEICRRCGTSVVYAPAAADVYPPGVSIEVPALPRVAIEPKLEDAARPGHFAGVCQVVMRLFRLVRPVVAVFGEKDWQQLQVVRAMVQRAELPIDIVGMATVREADGLALSSRNRFLSPEDRRRGLTLSRALTAAGRAGSPEEAEGVMARLLAEEGISPDYAVVRDAASLGPVGQEAARALIAARVGSVRLLDNMPWPNPAP
ncbi:MAG: pantoate--beta-alanine ligase [Phycisphaerales bacterium]|nr:pantoate--beta-alanine ligase [Phycisphaerales bacterium]